MTTYEVIQHQEVGAGGAASITFSNIPQTFTDLKLLVSLRGNTAYSEVATRLQFNGDTTNGNYANRTLEGTGSTVYSSSSVNGLYVGQTPDSTGTTATFSNSAFVIPNYTSSNYKSVSSDNTNEKNATGAYQTISAGIWNNSSAITQILIKMDTGSFVQYSSATLIGIKQAALPTPTDIYSDSLLEEIVLTSSAASVTFSNLDTYAALGYTNLQIRCVARTTRANLTEYLAAYFNADETITNYYGHILGGDGSSVASYAYNENLGVQVPGANVTSTTYGGGVIDILDPFDTAKKTTIRTLQGWASNYSLIRLSSTNWNNTAAATSIKLIGTSGGSLVAGSRFSLYGSK